MRNESATHIYVIDDLCNGCRMCQMMCSFKLSKGTFNPQKASIKYETTKSGKPVIAIDCKTPCHDGCLAERYCPTGALMVTTAKEAVERKKYLIENRQNRPSMKMRAPWAKGV